MTSTPRLLLAAALTLLAGAASADPVCKDKTTDGSTSAATNRIPDAMYFLSKPKDAAACAMHVENGHLVIDGGVTNPGMSCPDMAAWKLFADAVSQEFWTKWAADQQTWPGKPLPICSTSIKSNCCNPASATNPGYNDKKNPANNCPWFPGDHSDADADELARTANPPSKAHFNTFSHGMALLASARNAGGDTGRDIRQSMAELVFRNKPMFDFVFRNDIYHQEGIAAVFARNAANIGSANGLPYRIKSSTAALTEIDFPVDAVMIKSNWLEKSRAIKLGLRDDPAAPYVKMTINTRVTDNNGTILKRGEHWLVAMHISSKDIPNWLWATWEHVNNPGRCDYIGCNDDYGYASADKVGANQETNYTTPSTECDDLDLASWVFKLNEPYASGPRSSGLSAVFDGLGIGTKAYVADDASSDATKTITPTIGDRAWLSYRLKGSQTEFNDSTGHHTQLGNSVTEGGFMQSSSCVTCHARAGTNANGTIPLALGVFTNVLNETGYLQSTHGTPDPNLYFADNQPPALSVLQTDFVWGFLTAACLNGANFPCGSSTTTLKANAQPAERKSVRDLIR